MRKLYYIMLSGILIPMMAKAQKNNIPSPSNAQFVLEYNLPFIFTQTTAERLNLSDFGKQVYEEILVKNRNYESEFDIKKSGIDHSQKAYMHIVNTDSTNYEVRLIPIADIVLFKKAIGIDAKTKQTSHPKGTFFDLKYREQAFIPSSNEYAILVSQSGNYRAFNDSARAARWGMESDYDSYNYDSYDYTTTEVAEAVAWDDVTMDSTKPINDVATDVAEPASISIGIKEANDDDDDDDQGYLTVPPMVMYESPKSPESTTTTTTSSYNNEAYEAYQAKKDSIFNIWTKNFVKQLLDENQNTYSRLSKLKDFELPKNDAAATFYLNSMAFNASDIYSLFGFRNASLYQKEYRENETWSMFQLNFEPNAIAINLSTRISDEMAKSAKRIYKRKFSKKLGKYINSQSDIAMMSMAFNTQNYLEETPVIARDVMNGFGLWKDETDLYADLFATIIDEKAIGKLIYGDGAFVVTNVKEKEYKSIKYKWDEETYESSEEEVTEKEMLPNFLMMFTTKNTALVEKILNFGVKKNAYVLENGIYTAKNLNGSYDPFEYFCIVKDGIVFIGTEKAEIENIKNGKDRGGLSAADKKLVRNYSSSGWFQPRRLVGKFYKQEDDNLRMTRINNVLNNLGILQFTTGKMKGNKMYSNIQMQTANSRANSFEYLLYLIEDLKQF